VYAPPIELRTHHNDTKEARMSQLHGASVVISVDDSSRSVALENLYQLTLNGAEWGHKQSKQIMMSQGLAYESHKNDFCLSESNINNFSRNL